MLSYSRGALLALGIGLVFWFAVVPLRLRAAAPLIAAAVASAPVVAWAFARDALSTERIPLAARADAGHDLGALLAAPVRRAAGGRPCGELLHDRAPAGAARARKIAGRSLAGALAVVPVAIVLAVAASPGGLKGQTSDAWNKLTNPAASTPTNTPDRLTATSSVRARYWNEALHIYRSSKWIGAGAGAYVVARTRYRTDRLIVRHAHGYVIQTLADLGLIGVGLSLLAAAAWLAAAVRVDRPAPARPRAALRPRADRGADAWPRSSIVFAVHSLIDWTWFVPGNAVVALLCAGWVAGRPGLRERAAEPARSRRESAAPGASACGGPRWPSAPPSR